MGRNAPASRPGRSRAEKQTPAADAWPRLAGGPRLTDRDQSGIVPADHLPGGGADRLRRISCHNRERHSWTPSRCSRTTTTRSRSSSPSSSRRPSAASRPGRSCSPRSRASSRSTRSSRRRSSIPALKSHPKAKDIVLEGYEEHHVVDLLMGELESLDVSDETWGAKAIVMKENIEHHIEEEEGEMFKQARQVFDRQELEDLGARMAEREGPPRSRSSASPCTPDPNADADIAEGLRNRELRPPIRRPAGPRPPGSLGRRSTYGRSSGTAAADTRTEPKGSPCPEHRPGSRVCQAAPLRPSR